MLSPVKHNKAEKDFDKRQKTIKSLKSLHIRQSLFYSLLEKDRIMKIKDMLDDAVKERTLQWNRMRRLGIKDIQKLGFPTLDEIGIIAVHESYQFLSKTYVENDKTYIDVEEYDSSSPHAFSNSSATTFKRKVQSQVEIEANQDYELFSKYCATSDDNTLNVTNAEFPNLQRRNSCKAKIQNYDESIEHTKNAKMSRSNSLAKTPILMVSIDEKEQLEIDFWNTPKDEMSVEEKLAFDIDAAFSSNMTDFDLDGEVDPISFSNSTATSTPNKRAGEWTSAIYYRASNESINESPAPGGPPKLTLEDIKFLRRNSIGCTGIKTQEYFM